MDKEFLGRLIKNWAADNVFSSCGSDQFLVEQSLQHGHGIDTANILDLGNCHRLSIGNNRQRLQSSKGKLGRRVLMLDVFADPFMMLGFGGQFETVSNLFDL